MIKFENVTKIYEDGTKAVDNLNFEIEKGELCVLLGPSGCGKTTSLKMINRLISITKGKIYIDGVDNMKLDENELRRNIGYAIQEVGLFPHMTVAQNIEIVPALKGWPKSKRRERVKELLELVGMPPSEFMNKYPSELSGGQKQRVGVARALGADPPILLMDEPFGAIDPITREKLQDEFLRIQKEIKKTIVFVTHDIDEAIKLGDKIALMKDGKIVQYDTTAHLLTNPKDDFVKSFIGADRILRGLRLMKVREAMKRNPLVVKANERVEDIEGYIKGGNIKYLLVIDECSKFMGWIDLSDFKYEQGDKVKDIMVPLTETVTPEVRVSDALSLMLEGNTSDLPVVDNDCKLIGIITFDSIREAIRKIRINTEKEGGV